MSVVTVIVPIYNMSAYIDKCVESVLNQTYKDFVLLLIDDGSTDDSFKKCVHWSDKDNRISLVRKKNTGLGPTRNLGIKICETDYVTFLDADDWWHPKFLEYMIKGTEGGGNDVVLCDINFVYNTYNCGLKYNRSLLRFSSKNPKLEESWNLINRARTFLWGKLYKKSLFIDYNIEQPAHSYEDVAVTPYIIARARSVYYVSEGLYYYWRNRQGSIVNNFSSLKGLIYSLCELYQRFDGSGMLDIYYPSLRQLFWGQLLFVNHKINGCFSSESLQEQEQINHEIKKIVCECFPELKHMFTYTFAVLYDDKDIVDALRKIIIDEKQILPSGRATEADFCINYSSSGYEENNSLVICLQNKVSDRECLLWNIADEIFKQLWD